jgi:hypothetical protein
MELVTAENFKAPDSWEHFYEHLLENKRVLPIGVGDPGLLAKTSRKILDMIKEGNEDWKNWVPPEAHDMVHRRSERKG